MADFGEEANSGSAPYRCKNGIGGKNEIVPFANKKPGA